MNKEKILLIIDSLEANLKLLRLELDNSSGITESKEVEQPNNTISLRELIGKMQEVDDEPEPDYFEVDWDGILWLDRLWERVGLL